MTLVNVRSVEQPLSGQASRVRLGANPETPGAVLETLAEDPSVMVRAALALNPAASAASNQLLARDADERVRALLARKLASLAPEIPDDDQDRLRNQVYATLITLVEDEAVRVRAAIMDVVKQMPNAPRALILRLSRDRAISVSEPVIRFSPLLSTEDLLALLESPGARHTALAIARRPDLNARVADAIALGDDNDAIRALLENPSAQIREATLDQLIVRAADNVDWHEPLVRRPVLPPRSARALASILAMHLLEELANRSDLDAALLVELRERLEERLGECSASERPRMESTGEQAMAEAHRLARGGKLTGQAVLMAVQRADHRLVSTLLAVAASVPVSAVDRAVTLRSAKGLVSLVWKAGFSMSVAEAVQTTLGRLSPAATLWAAPSGAFPLAAEEMRWQVDFLKRASW
ncbi:MAG: DUF2336 domain-containing protein [Acetobacteraceae bacterium]